MGAEVKGSRAETTEGLCYVYMFIKGPCFKVVVGPLHSLGPRVSEGLCRRLPQCMATHSHASVLRPGLEPLATSHLIATQNLLRRPIVGMSILHQSTPLDRQDGVQTQ